MARYIKSYRGSSTNATVYTVPSTRVAKILGTARLGGYNQYTGLTSYVQVNNNVFDGGVAHYGIGGGTSVQINNIVFNEGGSWGSSAAMYSSSYLVYPTFLNYGPQYLAQSGTLTVYSDTGNPIYYNFVIIEEDVT